MAITSSKRNIALIAGAALGLALTGSVSAAQDSSDDKDTAYTGPSDEEVEVTAPREYQRGEYGAPIRNISMSRQVRFDDLDLSTRHGAHLLRARVRATALTLCREIETMHPVAAPDNPPCYKYTVGDALAQANEAIADARSQ